MEPSVVERLSAEQKAHIENLTLNGGRGLVVDPGRVGDWSQTYVGKRFYPADPRPEDVDLMDIIMGLGNICRYNGNVRFYSVAEHSVIVSRMVSEKNALVGLCHDFTEPYIGDMARPVKRVIGRDNKFFQLDKDIWQKAIAPKFGLPLDLPEEVVIADTQVCVLEKRRLRVRSQAWDLPYPEPSGPGIEIRAYLPPESHMHFMRRWCELTGASLIALKDEFMHYWIEDTKALWDERKAPRGSV